MDVMSLLSTWAGMADEDPTTFLTRFRAEWGTYGFSIPKDSSEMATLRGIRVLCEDGERRPLSEIYLPVPKLVIICKRYMLDHEKFGFLLLEKPISRQDGLGPWAFLDTQLGARTKDDVDFYLQILQGIRQENSQGKVEFPRRVMELYLRIHAACEASPATEKTRRQVRDTFENHGLCLLESSWTKPSNCLLNHLNYWLLKSAVLPTPESWESTAAECGVLKQFYHETLHISPNYSWLDVLDSLQKAQGSTATFWYPHLRKFYRALDEMLPTLSEENKVKLRSFFNQKPYIGVVHNGSLLWYSMSSCVWAPELIIPTKIDLSDHYRGLKSFFTGFLKVPKYDCGLIYNDLMDLDPTETSVEEAKEMLLSLNDSLTECGHLLNHRSLLSRPIFPVRFRDGVVRLAPATSGFLIGDKQSVRQQFLDRTVLLDFPAEDVWGLEPLILWAELEDRYLSAHVEEMTHLEQDATPQRTGTSFTAAQVRGLLRIAKHFRSPRVRSADQRQSFIRKLEQTQFFKTGGIYRQLSLNGMHCAAVADKQPSDLHIDDLEDQLRIYISNREGAYEFCFLSTLPRHLVRWIMAGPTVKESGRSTPAAVSAVKSILNVSDAFINDMLSEEGIIGDDETDLPLQSPTTNTTTNNKPIEQMLTDLADKPQVQPEPKASTAPVKVEVTKERKASDVKVELQSEVGTCDASITDEEEEEETSSDDESELMAELSRYKITAKRESVNVTADKKPELPSQPIMNDAQTKPEPVEDDMSDIAPETQVEPIVNDAPTKEEVSKVQSNISMNDVTVKAEVVEEKKSDVKLVPEQQPKPEHKEESSQEPKPELTGETNSDSTSVKKEVVQEVVVNMPKPQPETTVSDTPANGKSIEQSATDDKPESLPSPTVPETPIKEKSNFLPTPLRRKSSIPRRMSFSTPRRPTAIPRRMSFTIPRRTSPPPVKNQVFARTTSRAEERTSGEYELAQQVQTRTAPQSRIPVWDASPTKGQKEPWKIPGSKSYAL